MRPSINMRITLLATNDQETKRNCMYPITDKKIANICETTSSYSPWNVCDYFTSKQ